eukprot:gene4930-8527_t
MKLTIEQTTPIEEEVENQVNFVLKIKLLQQEKNKYELSTMDIKLKNKNILEIKKDISPLFNKIEPKNQTLIFKGIELKDENSIDDYVKDFENDIVFLILKPLKIYVKSLNGSLSCFSDLSPKISIENLKDLIEKKIGIFSNYSLLFDGKYLIEGNELCDYTIQDGSVLHLIKK